MAKFKKVIVPNMETKKQTKKRTKKRAKIIKTGKRKQVFKQLVIRKKQKKQKIHKKKWISL